MHVNFKSCLVLSHQTENRFSKLLFNSEKDKCIQSHVELFFKQNHVPIVRHNDTYRRQHK